MTDPLSARLSELLRQVSEPHPKEETSDRSDAVTMQNVNAHNHNQWARRVQAARLAVANELPAIIVLLAERAALNARVEEARGVIERAHLWFGMTIGENAEKGCDWLNEVGWDDVPEVFDVLTAYLTKEASDGR